MRQDKPANVHLFPPCVSISVRALSFSNMWTESICGHHFLALPYVFIKK